MNRRRGKTLLRTACVILLSVVLTSVLTGCKSHALKPNKQALASVGSVGSYQVAYEELYALAKAYDSEGISADKLRSDVYESIVTNYAILTLCDRYGVQYDKKEMDDAVQACVDSMIKSDFAGSRADYIDTLESTGRTDHLVRFNFKVDLIYSELELSLAQRGELLTEESAIIEHIKKNFVRTRHFMVANNAGDDTAKNLETAQAALADLRSGDTTMYALIGGPDNEDLLIPFDGYAFSRGTMEKAYENAAFALEVGEFSEVVTAKGELASGEYVDCYYVIERIAMDDEYINKHYDELYDSYADSVIGLMLEQISQELSFVPNEYGSSLDLKALEPVDAGTDVFVITVVCVCIGSVLAVALVIALLVLRFKKKKAAFDKSRSAGKLTSGKAKK